MALFPLLQGLLIGAGMIIPIGAQNSYVLNQGIKQNYHLVAASICIFFDMVLMSVGVFGGGALITSNVIVFHIITWGGIIFLTVYGGISFKSFLFPPKGENQTKMQTFSRKTVIFTTLAITLLNPHVYLDTVMIIGSISSQFSETDKFAFLVGTALASLIWFYSLSLAASKMSPWLSQPKVQRTINFVVALIMWGIAVSLFGTL